jgi:hypothetical protein
MQPLLFDLKTFQDIAREIPTSEAVYFAEGCAVAFEDYKHSSPTKLNVTGYHAGTIEISWVSPDRRGGWKEKTKVVHLAGIAVAFIVVTRFTQYKVIEESVIGTGIDYWLGNDDEWNFINARLEVSAIGKESRSNTVKGRVTGKEAQSTASDGSGLPVYVVVTEFAKPSATITYRKVA